jgi:hypothetical protein
MHVFDLLITYSQMILLLTTIYQMLSSSFINIFQYPFVYRSTPEYANEPLSNIQIADKMKFDA